MVNCNSDLSHKSADTVLEDGKQSPRYALLLPLFLMFWHLLHDFFTKRF